jgi:thymidylate synthase
MAPVIAVDAPTLGRAWLEVSRRILDDGVDADWDGAPTRELANVSLAVADPDPGDELIAALADPKWLDWMHRNFTEPAAVAELGDARSYASRLRDRGGRDQVAWVIERLRVNPSARDAAITTFEPELDTTYVPCISLLDFWIPDGPLELVVYAHSLDFGKKAYGNLVQLARLQHEVAAAVGVPVGRLVVHVKTAHVYGTELEAMRALLAAAGSRDRAAAR